MSYMCAIYAFSAILCAMAVEHNQQGKKLCSGCADGVTVGTGPLLCQMAGSVPTVTGPVSRVFPVRTWMVSPCFWEKNGGTVPTVSPSAQLDS
jgi:hypothetical protein